MDGLVKLFNDLESEWEELRKNQNDEKFVSTEFPKILQSTLCFQLDFRTILMPDLINEERKKRLRDIINSLKLDPHMLQALNSIYNVDTWSSAFGQSLLGGKFIGHLAGKYVLMEKRFAKESDFIIQSRIDALMQLFELSNKDEVSMMILNVLETYRKLIIRDTDYQNKISCSTMDKLQKNYMVIMCHRKQYEHLYSMIKTYPKYRKIQYVAARCSLLDTRKGQKTKSYEVRIAAACVEELLRCEFIKGRLNQDIHFFRFYLNQLIDLAKYNKTIRDDLERIILSASDMNVISDYYYLAATQLRLKMPNYNQNVVLKLISIGLSHDISYLEEIKYATDSETIQTSRGEVPRDEEFVLVHRRMYLALINLGCLIPHYPLARLCFHVASVCEPDTSYCKQVFDNLPECDYNDYDTTTLDSVLLNIRYLLEAFHYDIKGNTRLTTTYEKVSSSSFEKLDYFNHRVPLNEDLRPLEYPGVEKYLKKQNTEDKSHVSQVSDLEKCINENAEFNVTLSNGFKNLLKTYVKKNQEKYPSKSELYDIIKEVLFYTQDVKFTNTGEIYTNLVSMSLEEIMSNNFKVIEDYCEKCQKENSDNLYFDFKNDDEYGNENYSESLDDMYKSGVIKVLKLYRKGYCTIDIENILLFAIYEKKMKFLSEEFAYLNKNRNVELDLQQPQQQHNQIHAGFLFIINRRHPEFCRLSRLTSSLKKYYHAIDYYLDSYIFDGTPGKYKFILKYKTYKSKMDIPGLGETVSNAIEGAPMVEVKQEMPSLPTLPSEQQLSLTKKRARVKKSIFVKEEITENKEEDQVPKIPKVPTQATPRKVIRSNTVVLRQSNDRFNFSNEVRNFFLILQSEMSKFCGRDVKFNLQKLLDPTSSHTIHAVSMGNSQVGLKLIKVRNGRNDPRESECVVDVPLYVNGNLTLVQDFRDEIEYDEFNDNPRIKSSFNVKVSGSLVVERLSHNVKFEIDCVVDSVASKIKIGFQGSHAKSKKKPATPKNQENIQEIGPLLDPQVNQVLPHFPSIPPPSLPPSSSYANVVPNNDNYLNYIKSMPQENVHLPPFGSIAPSTSHFISQQPVAHYTQPPVFAAPTQEMTFSSTPIAPTMQYNNGNEIYQDSIVKEEFVAPQILQPPHHDPPQPKPKVEIQKVEIISPVKLPLEQNIIATSNNVQMKKVSFSANPEKIRAQNGNHNSAICLKSPQEDELVDFEDAIGSVARPSVIPIVVPKFEIQKSIQKISNAYQNEVNNEQNNQPIAAKVSVIKALPKPLPEDLQKSPPPLHHYAKESNCENNKRIEARTPTKAEQKFINNAQDSVIVKNGSNQEPTDTIDLTDDNIDEIDLTADYNSIRREIGRKAQKSVDFAFVACAEEPMRIERHERGPINGTNPPVKKYKSAKRSTSSMGRETKNCKIRLVDVMENLKMECTWKKNTAVRLIPVRLSSPDKNNHFVAETEPMEEEPIEEYADGLYDTEFTIVNYSSVSYTFNSLKTNPDGGRTNLASHSIAKNTNVHREKLNNCSNVNRILSALNVDLTKTSYSEKNRLNFSKNMKNYVKFNNQWSPKNNNDDGILNDKENIKKSKTKLKSESNNNSLLYQMSHDLINTLPGMNSFEFFTFPSRAPRRALQIEVVHLKDLKTSTSTSSSTSSTETSDLNDGTNSEPVNSSLHNDMAVVNGNISLGNSTVHVQKIGQTSISRENESKTFQTSFGTIIKNTYPPATSRDAKNIKKIEEKKVLITDGAKNNIKIIACTSQQHSTNEVPKVVNKNQTLINMLTQQVMMPTNSNRHYIITSKPADGVKVENSNIMVGTSGQQILRKNLATGQSQLVQILNSPPSNFTMKSLNVLTTTATSTKPSNQVVTVTSSPSSTSAAATPELPNSVKQQGIVQFICKTDGKIIHLTPICNNASGGGANKKITYKVDTSGARGPTILHHANQQIILNNQLRKGENPNILTIIQKQGTSSESEKKGKTLLGISAQSTSAASMSTRSIYEENYAKFIQTPSGTANASDLGLLTISSSPVNAASPPGTFIQKIGKTVIQSSGQILPKFNQAFGKSIFSSSITSSSTSSEQQQLQQIKKVVTNKETITRSIVNTISPSVVSKIAVASKNESKTEGPSTSILNIVDNESVIEKQSSLPTLQSALQGNNLLYARSIGNGKLIASGNNNNVLLTALRSNNSNQATTSNLRIITTMSETSNLASNRATIMTPVRISVPIQIPQLINSVRPQSPGNFRQQIVIATTTPTVKQQTPINNHQISSSKLETLLLSPQNQIQSHLQAQNTTITIPKQEIEIDALSPKMKSEQKTQVQHQVVQKKNVDNSTLEQLREFDMVLEQVLERSSATPNSVSSPPRPDSASRSSPRKHCSDGRKAENKSSSVSVASISPNDSPSSSKSLSGGSSNSKNLPKLQEDEHTAQRILDILANYKEQVRNSPDLNNKPAPRRRANPPTNPPASKRKKVVSSTGSIKNSKQFGSSSDVMTDTMGSEEDSSCGMGSGVASTGSINNSPRGDIDEHTDVSMDNNFYGEDSKRELALSPQSSSSSVATSPAHNKFSMSRRLLMTTTAVTEPNKSSSTGMDTKSNIIISSPSSTASSITRSSSSSINESIERFSAQGSTTAVLMPGNYILPMNVLKSGQQLAILSSNNGQKIIAVPANQLTSSHHVVTSSANVSSGSGTSIILQRYVNQISEGGASSALNDKAILTHSTNELESSNNQLKSYRLHASPNTAVSLIANSKIASGSSPSNQATTDFYAAVKAAVEGDGDSSAVEIKHESDSNASFVNDKTLITEIIQQQQQLARNHPQQNFMIKLNEPSDSSSIMFVSNNEGSSFNNDEKNVKIKSEEMDYEHIVIKEEAVDLQASENDILSSPMLNTKMEVDENTSSNHATDENSQKMQQFQSILNSCLSKQPSTSKNVTKNFLIDPSNKTLMCNDRKTATIDKEIFNPKSFSEECADLGVDEPIASDLFPEADLLFDSGSPKFDQINSHHDSSSSQIKREIENGEVLLQMNYSHNITEPWLNFDTEDELVDDSNGESSDEVAATKSSIRANL